MHTDLYSANHFKFISSREINVSAISYITQKINWLQRFFPLKEGVNDCKSSFIIIRTLTIYSFSDSHMRQRA